MLIEEIEYTNDVLLESMLFEFRIKGAFFGNFYKDDSRLASNTQLMLLKKQSGIFIAGYALPQELSYEIWYNNEIGKYSIIDRFGSSVGSPHKRLNDAVDVLLDFIGKEEIEGGDIVKFDITSDNVESGVYSRHDVEKVSKLLRDKRVIQDFVNSEIKEYFSTKLAHNTKRGFWAKIIGADIKTPSDVPYLNLRFGRIKQWFDTLVGKVEIVTFIKGFSLSNKIRLEIWYKKNRRLDVGTFEIVDVTNPSNPIQHTDGDLKSINDAVNEITKLLHVSVDEDSNGSGRNRHREI